MKKFLLLSALSLSLATTAMASVATNSDEGIRIDRTAHIPCAAEFDGIVESILSSKNMTFSDLESQKRKIMEDDNVPYKDSQKKVVNTTPLGDILNHPIAMSYLMRPASHLIIRDGIAVTDSKYENGIYGLLEHQTNNQIALWREHLGKKEFYEGGSAPVLVSKAMPLRASSQDVGLLSTLDTYPGDIFKIRNVLYSWEFQDIQPLSSKIPTFKSNPRFIITPNTTGNHATTLVHIMDDRRVFLTLLLNTLQTGPEVEREFGAEIMKRFNQSNFYCIFIDYFTCVRFTPAQWEARSVTADDSAQIGRISRTTPYVDASHNIQVQEEDQNCVLYANNFSNAAGALLSEKATADKVHSLAKKFVANPGDTDSANVLKQIFQNDLKKFLPQYYNADGSVKSAAELKKYHMDLRWEISGKSIQAFVEGAKTAKSS